MTTQYHGLVVGFNDCISKLGKGSFRISVAHGFSQNHPGYLGIQKTVIENGKVLSIEFFTKEQVAHYLKRNRE